MKTYKKVRIIAKNAPSGSYAAGCPSKDRGEECFMFNVAHGCMDCERTK